MDQNPPSSTNFEIQASTQSSETRPSMPEQAPLPQVAQPGQPQPVVQAAQPLQPIDPSIYGSPPAKTAQPIAMPAVADDVDLIEKEWVQKAKSIVTATRNDPHNQNKEMNKFKADYMKKRYNKDIKLPEGS